MSAERLSIECGQLVDVCPRKSDEWVFDNTHVGWFQGDPVAFDPVLGFARWARVRPAKSLEQKRWREHLEDITDGVDRCTAHAIRVMADRIEKMEESK